MAEGIGFDNTMNIMGKCYNKIRTYMVWKDNPDMRGEKWQRIANDYIRAFDWMDSRKIPENVQFKIIESINEKLDYLDVKQDLLCLLKEAKYLES